MKRILSSGLMLTEWEANVVLAGTPNLEWQRTCAGSVGSEGAQGS